MGILFECKDLKKKYGKKEALKGISLQIESGQIVGLLGPNGSGKTTLIKLVNGLLTPSGGEITINGNKIGVETKKTGVLSAGENIFKQLDESQRYDKLFQ